MSQIFKPPFGATLNTSDPLSQGLVGCWLLNEGGGLKANDLSGKGNHGTLTSGPAWVFGKDGKALSFDGVNDYVDLGTNGALTNFSRKSVFARFKCLDATDTGDVLSFGYWGANYGETFLKENGGFRIYIKNSTGTSVNKIIGDIYNKWVTLGYTWDGASVRYYLEGVNKFSNSTLSGTLACSSANWVGGNKSGGAAVNFITSDVRIWNRALSANEVKDLYVTPYRQFNVPKRRSYFLGNAVYDGASAISSGSALAGTASVIHHFGTYNAAVMSVYPRLLATGKLIVTGASAVTSGSALAATATLIIPGACAISSGSALAATGETQEFVQEAACAITSGSALSATPSPIFGAACAISSGSALVATGEAGTWGASNVSSGSVLSATGALIFNASCNITSGSALSATIEGTLTGEVAISSGSALAATAGLNINGACAIESGSAFEQSLSNRIWKDSTSRFPRANLTPNGFVSEPMGVVGRCSQALGAGYCLSGNIYNTATRTFTAVALVKAVHNSSGSHWLVMQFGYVSVRYGIRIPSGTSCKIECFVGANSCGVASDLVEGDWYMVAFGWNGTNRWQCVTNISDEAVEARSLTADTVGYVPSDRALILLGHPTDTASRSWVCVDEVGIWGSDLSGDELAEVFARLRAGKAAMHATLVTCDVEPLDPYLDLTENPNQSVTLTAVVRNGTNPRYKWYNATTNLPIAGATSSTYTAIFSEIWEVKSLECRVRCDEGTARSGLCTAGMYVTEG